MRKSHASGGAPDRSTDALWEFSALDAEDVLNTTRSRSDGKSIREAWCNRRTNLARRRVMFCKATVRKPLPYRNNKIDDRKVVAVYLGRARRKKGWYFWSPELGIVSSTNATFYETEFPFKDGSITFDPTLATRPATVSVPGRRWLTRPRCTRRAARQRRRG